MPLSQSQVGTIDWSVMLETFNVSGGILHSGLCIHFSLVFCGVSCSLLKLVTLFHHDE